MNNQVDVLAGPEATKTFPQFIRAAASAYGDDIAITLQAETIPNESASFIELERRSAEIAKGMIANGVGKGTRVGFMFGNSPSFATIFAAIARIGAIAVPISTLIKANELVRVLKQSDVTCLFVQRRLLGNDYVERLCDALPGLRDCGASELRLTAAPYLRWVVSTGDDLPASVYGMDFITDAAKTVSEELLVAVEAEVHPTDQLIEIYTSGSMALPKGVKHNHGPIMFRTHYLRGMQGRQRGGEVTAVMPMFWVGGLMIFLMPNWEAGGKTICTEGTSTNSKLAMGSVLSEADLKRMDSRPYWGLGMSETIGPYAYGDEFRAPGYPLCAPMDHIADGYEVRIGTPEGVPVPDGEIGEMQVRGYPVSPGIHKLERAGYYMADGYYHTGDMCRVEGSRIHFIGRSGEMIKTAGSNVSPAEVEMEMQQLPGVESAYVVGLPDADRGQLVVAAVVAAPGAKLDFDDIQAKLRKLISSFKVPRAYVEIAREDVPMLPSNKVAKRQIEQMMAQKLGRAP